MANLNARDLRAGLHVVRQLALAGTAEAYARQGVQLLGEWVASELTTLSVCDLESGRRHVIGAPQVAIGRDDRAAFDRHFGEHPLVRHHAYARGRDAHRISDSVPFARFRHTALYADYYRRIGLDHAIALPLHVDDRLLVSFVLNRKGRDFSDRERAQLDAVTPALADLYRQVCALDRARDAEGALVGLLQSLRLATIRIDAGGAVRDFSPAAAACVRQLWGEALRRRASLPATLRAALAGRARRTRLPLTRPHACRVGALRLHIVPLMGEDGGTLLVLQGAAAPQPVEDDAQRCRPALPRWPLSPRQREVLHWLAAGKTDREIGALLAISPRTVGKHLQRIYDALGVETRTAAVMRALGTRE